MFPNVWSERQLFAFSGIDGQTDWPACFVGSTVGGRDRFGIRFHCEPNRTLWIDATRLGVDHAQHQVVMCDFIRRDLVAAGEIVRVEVAAVDKHSVCGRVTGPAPLVGKVHVEAQAERCQVVVQEGIEIHNAKGNRTFLLSTRRSPTELAFTFMYAPHPHPPTPAEIHDDLDRVIERRLAFFYACPKANVPERLGRCLLKACSVLKVNVESAQGVIPCRWTTPDRIPHRRMWLWDSAFHALGYRHIDPALSRDALVAVFHKQRPDGFIPHMMSPMDDQDSTITQPPVLAWGTWKTYEVAEDRTFLEAALPRLEAYLEWDIAHRRPSDRWLFAWHSGDESGMDNSPRFDSRREFYAVDFSALMAHECEHVSRIARELGDGDKAERWADLRQRIADAINSELWDPDAGFYFDRFLDGASTGIKSEAAFVPLLAGVPDAAQTASVVKHLCSPDEFWTPLPVPSVSADDPEYGDDMWRGPVWINYNYMIIRGLERCGQPDVAQELKQKTLAEIARWYHELGCIFEFYDAEGSVSPLELDRKGYKQDPRRMSCIADYNWSAAAFVDLVMA